MVDKENPDLSVRKQCELLGITRSNLYYEPCMPDINESILANEIHDIWMDMPYYGYRRITAELHRRGHKINHKKISRIMKDMNIQALYPKHRTTIINQEHKKYPYLLKELKIERPNQVWGVDITYIKIPSGFMYLIGIIDLYSRYLVKWSFSNTMETQFCIDAFESAISIGQKPEILNTDQGSQFTSESWTNTLENNNIKISMDGKGRWADNIIIERFWRTLKHEHVLLHGYNTAKEARESIGQFIETYNHKRLHQSLNYKTPAEVYL